MPALDQLAGVFEQESSIEAEIQLIGSRSNIGKSITELGFDIQVTPQYFPVVGQAISRLYGGRGQTLAPPLFGLDTYAWGGERLEVALFEVPNVLVDVDFTLIYEDNERYTVYLGATKLLSGRVGVLSEVALNIHGGTSQEIMQIHVTRITARPKTRFVLKKIHLSKAIDEFSKSLRVKERGRNSGMISLEMVGNDPGKVTDSVNVLAQNYVAQNIARSAKDKESSLQFLDEQLPMLQAKVEQAENAYDLYRQQHGSIDLASETEAVLRRLNAVSTDLLLLEQQRQELRERFKSAHPSIEALDSKIRLLKSEEQRLEKSSDSFPRVQKEILRLAREVEMNQLLYSKLLNTAQELRVAKAGTVGNVRIIDQALWPLRPVWPQSFRILAITCVLSLMASLGLALVLRALRGGMCDPDEIEQRFGLPVYASVCQSREQLQLNRRKSAGDQSKLLALEFPKVVAIEALRSLRTSLLFSLGQSKNNRVMISSPSPAVGKSFVSANTACLVAQAGHRVLLIDCDLRRSTVHDYFGLSNTMGLSDLVNNQSLNPMSMVKSTVIETLSILTAGSVSVSPSELLLHPRFGEVLQQLGELFDVVFMDCPPILAVTDAAIVARHSGLRVMVLKSDTHHAREIQQAVKQFSQTGFDVNGFVFNKVKANRNSGAVVPYVYQYEYR